MNKETFYLFIFVPFVFLFCYAMFERWYKGYDSLKHWWYSEILRKTPRR